MGNTCPAPHSKHIPFCETFHEDVAKSMHLERSNVPVEHFNYSKVCGCFDGFTTDKEVKDCVTGKWACSGGDREEVIRNPECLDWMEYMDDLSVKVQKERQKIERREDLA